MGSTEGQMTAYRSMAFLLYGVHPHLTPLARAANFCILEELVGKPLK